ncbi:choice-of-anchor G family protein [Myceligenerans indicum]|uniref:Choice-of-anchor G family protein n=1 Tax=Myceligenerans indicum TaxID=2593663 RepID=A0ABS1LHN6_9MICO|nr:choice-of-anchor G family protein [Myceligenerans indicum]MBL0885333.1 choice-of-anchor G family protein [Myceligenerans indicum]
MSVPAQALDTYPDDPAEAGAGVLMSELMEQELVGAATSDAGWDTDAGPNTQNLDADLLGSQLLQLGDVALPVDQFMDLGQLGALASTSEATSPFDGRAASGLIGPDGGVTIDGTAEGDWGTTTLDLLALADTAGVAGITDAVADRLDLQLGAMGSEVIAEDGVFLDPDGGVTGPGQYVLGDASLLLHSPAIEDAAAQIYDLGGQIDTTVEDLVNQVFDVTDLISVLDVPGLPAPDCSVDSNMQETIVNAVVGEPLTSANQLVTIDFSTGEAQIHLEHLVEGNDPWAGGDDAGMNGLAPNTEVIDDQTYPQVAEGVHELIEEAIQIMATAIDESLSAVTISCQWYQEGPLPGDVIDVSWTVNLADAAGGNFPPVEQNCTGATASIICTALATTVNTAGVLLTPVFATVYDFLVSDEGHAVFDLLITDIKTGLVTQTVGNALSPVFDVVTQFVSLQINHQETTTCTTDAGDESLDSLQVSALWLGLAQGDLGSIGLGNSAVRVDACGFTAVTPALSAAPAQVVAGDCTVVSGEGYTPSSTVTVQLTDADGNPVGDPVMVDTDANGAFTVEVCPAADASPGDYTVIGTDDTTGTPAETPVMIQPAPMEPSVSVDPGEVAPGETTDVTGDGYTPNSTVTVQLTDADGNPVGDPVTVDTDDTGMFTTPVTVPADAEPGGYTITGTDDATGAVADDPLTVTPVDVVAPSVSVDPGEVVPGDCAVVSGEGYTPSSTVTVQLTDADGNPVGDPVMVDTDANGAFSVELCVPAGAEPGDFSVIGTDDESGTPAQTPLTVTPEPGMSPTIVVDPDVVAPGDATEIVGAGYTPDSTVTIQLVGPDGNPVGGPVTTVSDEMGGFTLPAVIMKETEPGDYTITGTDDTTGAAAQTSLTVTPPLDAVAPAVSVDSAEVVPGDCAVVSGEGYTPSSTVTVQLTDADGNPVGDPVMADTDADGAFSVELCVPAGAKPGDFSVIGTDDESGTPAQTPLTVAPSESNEPDVPGEIDPVLSADPSQTEPGGSTDVTGEGYTPDSTVTVQLTDADGNPVGDPVADVPTDADGMFTTPLVVPEDAEPGDFMVTGTDDTTDTAVQAPLTVTDGGDTGEIDPAVTAEPVEVEPGASTDITGTGYTPNGMVTLYLTDADGNVLGEPEPFEAEADGTFVMALNVPDDAEIGVHTVVGVDEATGLEATTMVYVVSDGQGGGACSAPTMFATTETVMAGGDVVVTGMGFTAGTEVEVQLTGPDGEPLGEPVMATVNDRCGFQVTVAVPEGSDPGLYEILATPEDGSDGASVPIAVCGPDGMDRVLKAWFEEGTVSPGDTQTFYASGFDPGELVIGEIHGSDITFKATAADEDGVVSWTFTIPSDFTPEIHVGVATSAVNGDRALASFFDPPAPGGDESASPDGAGDDGAGDGAGGGRLAATGSEAWRYAALSFLLLAAGAVLIRRRKVMRLG